MAEIVGGTSELVKLDALKKHPSNPRMGDVGAIVTSIQANGFYGTLVVQRSTGYVLAGNHRLQAAKACGLKQVPVVYVDVDDETAKRILLADNRTNDLASYDNDQLAELLQELAQSEGLEGTGYDGDDLDALLKELSDPLPEGGDAETNAGQTEFGVVVDCTDEAEQTTLLERLTAEGYSVRAVL